MMKKKSKNSAIGYNLVRAGHSGNIKGGTCAFICGNFPLCENLVYILFKSSEWIGFFKLNFAALIQVPIKTF